MDSSMAFENSAIKTLRNTFPYVFGNVYFVPKTFLIPDPRPANDKINLPRYIFT